MSLDERKKRILSEIVLLYESIGEPVGSGLLAKHIEMTVSTATLRAEMAALTRLGLLAQPHTSAGRVPSTEGYRYYVENLMERHSGLKKNIREHIDRQLTSLDRQTDRFMQGVASSLSDVIGLPAFSTLPRSENMQIAQFRLLQVGQNTVLIVAVASEGTPHTRVVRLYERMDERFLRHCSDILNSGLCFISRQDITVSMLRDIIALLPSPTAAAEIVMGAVALMENMSGVRVYYEGLEHLVHVSENGVGLNALLNLIGDRDAFYRLLSVASENAGVLLCEGMECGANGLVVLCETYQAGGGLTGRIGVLGPERLSYRRAIPTIRYYTDRISGILTA